MFTDEVTVRKITVLNWAEESLELSRAAFQRFCFNPIKPGGHICPPT